MDEEWAPGEPTPLADMLALVAQTRRYSRPLARQRAIVVTAQTIEALARAQGHAPVWDQQTREFATCANHGCDGRLWRQGNQEVNTAYAGSMVWMRCPF